MKHKIIQYIPIPKILCLHYNIQLDGYVKLCMLHCTMHIQINLKCMTHDVSFPKIKLESPSMGVCGDTPLIATTVIIIISTRVM